MHRAGPSAGTGSAAVRFRAAAGVGPAHRQRAALRPAGTGAVARLRTAAGPADGTRPANGPVSQPGQVSHRATGPPPDPRTVRPRTATRPGPATRLRTAAGLRAAPPSYGQPPGSGQPPSGPPPYGGQPPYGQAPPYGQPGYGQPATASRRMVRARMVSRPTAAAGRAAELPRLRAGGWNTAGAPQPGGIPLRPLALGDILNGSFTAIRRNPAATVGLAAIVLAVSGVVSTAVSLSVTHAVTTTPGTVTSSQIGHDLATIAPAARAHAGAQPAGGHHPDRAAHRGHRARRPRPGAHHGPGVEPGPAPAGRRARRDGADLADTRGAVDSLRPDPGAADPDPHQRAGRDLGHPRDPGPDRGRGDRLDPVQAWPRRSWCSSGSGRSTRCAGHGGWRRAASGGCSGSSCSP